jgi:hypothetical protein
MKTRWPEVMFPAVERPELAAAKSPALSQSHKHFTQRKKKAATLAAAFVFR